MTEMDVQAMEWNMAEYREYVKSTSMTKEEHRLVLEWVLEGNRVYDNTSYAMQEDGCTPIPFLEEYRMEEKIRRDIRGMTPEEVKDYLDQHFQAPRQAPAAFDDEELPF